MVSEVRTIRPGYRLDIALRTIGATFGAYAVAALTGRAFALTLPGPPTEAAIIGTIAGVLAMPAVSIGMFGARSALRAWGWLSLVAGALATIAWLAGPVS